MPPSGAKPVRGLGGASGAATAAWSPPAPPGASSTFVDRAAQFSRTSLARLLAWLLLSGLLLLVSLLLLGRAPGVPGVSQAGSVPNFEFGKWRRKETPTYFVHE